MVYVTDTNGQPLMPTKRYGFVRRLLKSNKAKVIKRCPFVIQLLYKTTNVTQPVSLGVDAGSKTIGLSATTEDKELYAGEVTLRNDIAELLSARREQRRSRRSRKTRYRAPRFNNRTHGKKEGWLAPSIENKINIHLKTIENLHKILPISKIIVETASFDIQKIKNPDISGVEYQQGEMLDAYNVREYVLYRDGHTCQCCKGKSKDKVLCVHHIESRKTGGNAPNNLITLCETCHQGYHKGTIELPKHIKRGMKFADATFMGIMRWAFYNKLREMSNIPVTLTYGYITKSKRIESGLPKTHAIDARCISGNSNAEPLGCCYYIRKIRCHNRQIHKFTVLKGGVRKNNQAAYEVFGYRLFDKVLYNKKECFITARRTSGSFMLKTLDNTPVHAGVSYKKLKLVERAKHYITERRVVSSPMHECGGFHD